MAAKKLSSATVETLAYKPNSSSWSIHWHHKVRGFGLRVTANGARSYVVRFRLRGCRAQKLKVLGSTDKLTFGQAQENAREVLRLATQGVDWFEAIERDRSKTVAGLWAYYIEHKLGAPDVSDGTRRNAGFCWTSHGKGEFGNRATVDVTAGQARDWHKRVTKGSGAYVANRACQYLRAAWNYGKRYGQVQRELDNPFAAVELNKEQPRQTILAPESFPKFATAVNALADPFARAYIWTLFYTGCRRTELLKLTWADVAIKPKQDDEPRSGSLMLRVTKGSEPRTVALSAPAVEILEALPRTENPHVFCGAVRDTHLDPKKHWESIRTAAELPELRLHDLRRSFGSWLGASGFSSKQIGATLGHKTDITSRVYIQLGEAVDLKRQLVSAHAKLADEFRKPKPKAEVIDMATAAGARR
jgi:integrase